MAGRLQSYHYDPQEDIFECSWAEEGQVTAPSRVYLPDWFPLDGHKVELAPAANGFKAAATSPGSNSVYIEIPPAGQACTRHLVIEAQ